MFTAELLNADEDAVGRMLNHPHSIVSLSDAGAHLTFFNDARLRGLHLLGHWARDARCVGDERSRAPTHGASATVFGIKDRGLIREGLAADLLAVRTRVRGPWSKHRVFDLPGGAPRLTTDAVGVHGVWVNGAQVADRRGLLQEAPLAGQLLTEFAA